ncbi:hypothetical protein [Oceanicella sp. SM1341]|uniref:hypothetical protein n=1 Tax=Oceanicella sp. SM1341 TaxID=1548889 RepID=UPI000E52C205|nr:hypothetical protein [Oceanicella sp. SM1341]
MADLISALAALLDGILAATGFVFGLLSVLAAPGKAVGGVSGLAGAHPVLAGLGLAASALVLVLLLRRRRRRRRRSPPAQNSSDRPRLQP